jgi:hypothetical protein
MPTPKADEFASLAIVSRDGRTLSHQERIDLSLGNPTHDLAAPQGVVAKVTKNNIRRAMQDLAEMNIHKVDTWLNQVAVEDPKEAVRLFLSLAEFTLPKLKAVAVAVQDNTGTNKQMSIADLQAIISEQ